jgi:glycosyltransferase involved in cell wall biosynthesis
VTVAEPDDLADAVRTTVSTPDERAVLAARRLAEERYDWRVLGARFATLVGEVLR